MRSNQLSAVRDNVDPNLIHIYAAKRMVCSCHIETIKHFIGDFMATEFKAERIDRYDFIIQQTQFCSAR